MLYIQQHPQGSSLVFEKYTTESEKAPISIIKLLCQELLMTYESRILLTKKRFNIHSMVPIYINSATLMMPTGSPRSYETIWINYLKIASIQKYGDHTVVLFTNLSEIEVNISYTRFKEKMKYCKIIYDYMENLQSSIL
jgi:competence transcription factor ComK